MRCLLLWRRRRFTIFMMVEKAFQGRTVIDVKSYLRSMALSELLNVLSLLIFEGSLSWGPLLSISATLTFRLLCFWNAFLSQTIEALFISLVLTNGNYRYSSKHTFDMQKSLNMMRMIVMSLCGQCVKSDLSKRECDANDNLDLRPGSSS